MKRDITVWLSVVMIVGPWVIGVPLGFSLPVGNDASLLFKVLACIFILGLIRAFILWVQAINHAIRHSKKEDRDASFNLLFFFPIMAYAYYVSSRRDAKLAAEEQEQLSKSPGASTMTEIWEDLRGFFVEGRKVVREIRLENLDAEAIQRVFEMLWRRGRDVTAGGATVHDLRDDQLQPIVDAGDAARLVCKGEADPVYVVLAGLESDGAVVPDLGVRVSSEEINLDYRPGPVWGTVQLAALFRLLFEITTLAPSVVVRHEQAGHAFSSAWERYRQARCAG